MGKVETFTIDLPAEMADFVREAVEQGQYASPNEAIGDAIREWKERHDNHGYSIEELREMVAESYAEGESDVTSFDEMMAEIHRLREIRLKSSI